MIESHEKNHEDCSTKLFTFIYHCMQNLYRFLEFVKSFIKISEKSSKVQNKKTEL